MARVGLGDKPLGHRRASAGIGGHRRASAGIGGHRRASADIGGHPLEMVAWRERWERWERWVREFAAL